MYIIKSVWTRVMKNTLWNLGPNKGKIAATGKYKTDMIKHNTLQQFLKTIKSPIAYVQK